MRISPKSLLQGLLFLAPVTLLALASCGGGGGGTSATLASAYTLSVNVTGVSGVGLVLRNGGENHTVTAPGTFSFTNHVLSGTTYNISVLSQPTPTQLCTFTSNNKTSLTGVMPASNTTVGMSCVAAFKIGGTISGLTSDGLVLQNNGGDNFQAASSVISFTFSTPVTSTYNVTMLTPPLGVGQTCTLTGNSGVTATDYSSVNVSCSTSTATPDRFVYASNMGSTNNVYAFKSSSGTLTANGYLTQGSGRAAIAADRAGQFVLIASGTSSGSVASYKINSTTGGLTKVSGVATGNTPFAIAIHPSGKFAYVVNKGSNSVSAYSIGTDGTLASIDANGATTTNEPTIAAGYLPVAIAIDPTGAYAYVLNTGSNTLTGVCGHGTSLSPSGCISAYIVNASTGALTPTNANGTFNTFNIDTGSSPSAIAIDPAGKFVYVTNEADNTVSEYALNSTNGLLTPSSQPTLNPASLSPPLTVSGPSSIAFYPDGTYAYVTYANSDKIVAFQRDTGTGALNTSTYTSTPTGTTPNSVSIDSSGAYAYVANYGAGTVWSFQITGGVTLAKVDSIVAGTNPVAVITAP